jgi:hypothetical protein
VYYRLHTCSRMVGGEISWISLHLQFACFHLVMGGIWGRFVGIYRSYTFSFRHSDISISLRDITIS